MDVDIILVEVIDRWDDSSLRKASLWGTRGERVWS